MNKLLRRIGYWLRQRKVEEELAEEIEFHRAMKQVELERSGLSPDEAVSRARRELGSTLLAREDSRGVWIWPWLDDLWLDVRYALRTMTSNKTFSALAILSLALGIGANTAIFSFMDAILLRSLPVQNPQSLVTLSWHTQLLAMSGMNHHDDSYGDPKEGLTSGVFAYPAFELFHKDDTIFSSVFGYQGIGVNLTVKSQADVANGEYVSGEYFSGLGVLPASGRLITSDDDRAGAPAAAVISFAASQKYFGGAAAAPGQSIRINNIPFTVIGVSPPEFFGADPDAAPDIYFPMHTNLLLESADRIDPPASWYLDPDFDWIDVMARLRPGVTTAHAQAALAVQFSGWQRSVSTERTRTEVATLIVKDGRGGLDSLRRRYSKPLYMLLTLVGLILSLACANIANLLLARSTARKREMAVRLSMGAGRLRVIRQLLTESVLLASLGGALGIALAVWGIRLLTLLLANGQENFTLRAELNWHVLVVVAGLSILTGVLFGLAPAIQSTRVDLMPGLKTSRTGELRTRSFSHLSLSRLLMVSQIAITLLILVAAGLFIRTLSNFQAIEVGFNRENVLTFQVNARQAGHGDPEIVEFYNYLRTRFAAIPGVRAASLSEVPLIGHGYSFHGVSVAGAEPKTSRVLAVGTGFFSTMQIPILLGREIEDRDQPGTPLVAVVNEVFAKSNLGGQNPLGQRLAMPSQCAKCELEIVGVSGNALYGNLGESAEPTVYLPFTQASRPVRQMVYELRSSGNPLGLVHNVREIVHQADPRLPLADVKTQSALIDQTINQEITFARLCTAFGVLALSIACIGLYGTMSYNVARRTNEIGIRMALGAQRGRVVWMVLREVFLIAAVALVISIPTAIMASRFVESFLFGMKPNDPLALTAALLILVSAVTIAGYLPARSASELIQWSPYGTSDRQGFHAIPMNPPFTFDIAPSPNPAGRGRP